MLNSKTILLPVNSLKIDPAYQRKHDNEKSKKLINEIGKNFNRHAFGIITVTKRQDGYYVVDGYHRVMGAKLAGIQYVLCLVADGLKVSGEAATYLTINTSRKNQTYVEIFQAKLTKGDLDALDIKNILERFDFSVMKTGNHKNYIKSVKELEIIYKLLGRANFVRLFYLLRHTWNGAHQSLLKEFLLGMTYFIEKAGESFSDSEFVKKMSNVALIDIIKDAKLYLLVSSDRYAYAKAILKHYNFRRSKQIPEKIFYQQSA